MLKCMLFALPPLAAALRDRILVALFAPCAKPTRLTLTRARPSLEGLEDRAVPAVTWDPVGTFTFRSNLQVWQAGNFVSGQQGKVVATYQAGPAPTDYNVGSVSYPGGRLNLNHDGDRQEGTFLSGGGPARISTFRADSQDPDDVVRVELYAQRLANLRALPPRLNPDGGVTYGYQIDGSAEVVYRDWVEVQLYYATGPNKSQVTQKVAGHNLQSQPGGPIEFTVPADWFRQYPPPAGTTHLVTWIDRDNKAAEYDESDADNAKSLALPNLAAVAPTLNADGTVTIGYRLERPPFVTDQTLNVQAWYSRTERWEDRIGADPAFLTPMDPNLNGTRFVVVPQANLAAPPAGAAYLLTRVDRYDLVRESNEADNTQALKLPDLKVAYARLDDQQGLVARVERSGGSVPAGSAAKVSVYWASGPTAADRFGGPVFSQAISNAGTQWVVVPYSRLGDAPTGATHLVVVADPDAKLPESGESDNAAGAVLAPAKLSLSARRLDFGDVTVRRSKELELEVSNTGWHGSVLHVGLQDPGGAFTIVSVGGAPARREVNLRGGASVNVRVRFAPDISALLPGQQEQDGALAITASDGATQRRHTVALVGVAVPARPANLRLVARPATSPDNGVLVVEMHFESTSGDINDLFLLPSGGVPLLSAVRFQERLSIKGAAPGPAFSLPAPFKGTLPNPKGGTVVGRWSDATDGLSHFGDFVIAGTNDAYFVDRHGYTGFHPITAPLTGLRLAGFTVLQQYEVSVPWVDGGKWKPIGPVYEIERSVSQGKDAAGNRVWYYSVRKGGQIRRLNLTNLPAGVIPTS